MEYIADIYRGNGVVGRYLRLASALLLIPQFWRPLEKISPPRIDDEETVTSIRSIYSVSFPTVAANEDTIGKNGAYILDPHSTIGVAASLRSISASSSSKPASAELSAYTISLATAHPAKFVIRQCCGPNPFES